MNGIPVSRVQEKKFTASRLLGESTSLNVMADAAAKNASVQQQNIPQDKENEVANHAEREATKAQKEEAVEAAAVKKAAAAEMAAEAKAAKEAAAKEAREAKEAAARAKAQAKAAKATEPKPPKRPSNLYACFISASQASLKEEQPSLTPKEVMKALGERWKALGDIERAPFAQAAEADDVRYREEYADYVRACAAAGISPVAEAPQPKAAQLRKPPPAAMTAAATGPDVVELDSPSPLRLPKHTNARAPHSEIGRRIPHAPHLDSMAALVGRCISVYWDGDECYFEGTLKEFSASDERHLVVYADGEQKWHHLENEIIRWPSGTPVFLRKAQAVQAEADSPTSTSSCSRGDGSTPPYARAFDLDEEEGGGGSEDIVVETLRVAPPPVQQADPPSDASIPRELCCPLTLELFVDPVKTIHEQIYEREAIEDWLRTNTTDPMTSLALPVRTLYPDDDMRRRCDELRTKRSTMRAKPPRGVQRKAKESTRAMGEAAHAQQNAVISLAAQVTKHAKRKTIRAGDIDLISTILNRNGLG